MKKIHLSYENGYVFEAYLVRYFKFKNNAYLIYTFQEKDEKNYMKLYVVKVMKELGSLVTQTVRRTDEWNMMKQIVKQILTETKAGKILSIEDFDPNEIENIAIYENKSFNLANDLVNILSKTSDRDVENVVEVTLTEEEKAPSQDIYNINPLPQQSEKVINPIDISKQVIEEQSEESIEVLDL